MTEAVSGKKLRQLLFAPDNMNTLFYAKVCETRCPICILHNTTIVLHLWAGGCVAEIEECLINIAKVVGREKAHTEDSSSVLWAVWVAAPTELH